MAKRIYGDTEVPELTPERRYVYNGTQESPPAFTPRGNRPVKRRRRNTSLVIGGLLAVSLLIVLYIWNKITVDRLAIKVNDLHAQYEKILDANETLRAEINKKSGLERIGKAAAADLKLVPPKEQPVWFEIDADRLEQFKTPEGPR